MAYIYMPLFFTLLGYGIVYAASLPVLDTFNSVINIITSDEVPVTDTEFNVIYDKELANNASSNSDKVKLSDISMPYYKTQYAYILCERISLDAPVFWGDNSAILRNGIGQYIGSSIPGMNLPIMLCGHNATFCLPLKYIEIGDIITIKTNYGTYEYKVSDMQVHNLNDTSAYNLGQEKEQLIIYTCYPFDLIGSTDDRLYIYADKISGQDIDLTN